MDEISARAARTAQKDLVRFVRSVVSHAPVRIEPGEAAGTIRLKGAMPSRTVSQATVAQAVSLGLAIRDGDIVRATPQALPFLRRALVTPDEAFQEQHREIETATVAVDGMRQAVRVNQLESPLGAAARLKEKSGQPFLPPQAIMAGERLHADFTRANLQPRLTMTYEPRLSTRTRGGAGGAADLSDSAMSARFRVGKAMEAIGPELCGVALDVCCFQKGLEIVERERQWPARSAKLMLRTALMALARHYAPPPPAATRKNHAWGAEGYRPEAGDIVL